MTRRSKYIGYSVVVLIALAFAGWRTLQSFMSPPSPINPVIAGADPMVTIMDFASPPSVSPASPGWWEIGFLTKPKMKISFQEIDGIKALRCETAASGSIFGRHTDIDLSKFPTLKWGWRVEKPVVSPLPEANREGDDHPARFLVQLRDSKKQEHHFEIIWSNGAFKKGAWKVIGGFQHYVANGGDAASGENTNQWFMEEVNLLNLYRTATGRNDNAQLINLSIFCDTDDTGAQSVAYFGTVSLHQ